MPTERCRRSRRGARRRSRVDFHLQSRVGPPGPGITERSSYRFAGEPSTQFGLAVGTDHGGDDVSRLELSFWPRSDELTVPVKAQHEAARRPGGSRDSGASERRTDCDCLLDQDRAAVCLGEQTQRTAQRTLVSGDDLVHGDDPDDVATVDDRNPRGASRDHHIERNVEALIGSDSRVVAIDDVTRGQALVMVEKVG